jgi:hypothetical protein
MERGDLLEREELLYRRAFRLDKRYVDPHYFRPTSRAFAPRPKDEGKREGNYHRGGFNGDTHLDYALFCKKNDRFCRSGIG